MRTFALKTQFGIIVAFLLAFALGASVSSFLQESRWIREREAGRLSPQQAAQVLASRSDDEDIRGHRPDCCGKLKSVTSG
jgi:hypothetical protein